MKGALKFLVPLIGIIAGILVSSDLIREPWLPALSLALALFFWLTSYILTKDPLKGIRYIWIHNVWVGLLFFSLGSFDYLLRCKTFIEDEIENRNLFFTGIIEEIKYLADGDRYRVDIENVTDSSGNVIVNRNLSVLLKTDGFLASKGDRITFRASPQKIDPDKNKTNAKWLRDGIGYYCRVRQTGISVVEKEVNIFHFIEELRDEIIIKIENSSLHRETGNFLISVLLGDRTFLSQDIKTQLSSAGLAHILALSGMHVAIIYSFFLFLLFPLSFAGHYKLRKFLAILLIWIYVCFSGASPSTVRAAIMATIVAGGYIMERKNSALNSLCFAGVVILLLNPLSLWDIGFQMSFLCVLSIILFVSKLNPIDHKKHPYTYKLMEAALATIIVTFFTWTLVAYYFQKLPLLFLPANILLLPLLPVFIGGGFFFIILLLFDIDISLLSKFLESFHDIFIGSANFLSLNGSSVINVGISSASVVFWIVGGILLGISLHSSRLRSKKLIGISGVFSLLCSLILLFNPKNIDQQDSLQFLHSLTKMEILHTTAEASHRLTFPRQTVSTHETERFHIIALDTKVTASSLNKLKMMHCKGKKYMIIGTNADLNQVADLIAGGNFSKVILHAGVGKKKKAELLGLIDENMWENIYSLRDNGSLDVSL